MVLHRGVDEGIGLMMLASGALVVTFGRFCFKQLIHSLVMQGSLPVLFRDVPFRHGVSSETNGTKISPWFKLIARTLLPDWWKHLGNIKSLEDHGIEDQYTGYEGRGRMQNPTYYYFIKLYFLVLLYWLVWIKNNVKCFVVSSGLLIVYLIIKNLPPNFRSFNEMFVTYRYT